MSNYVLSCESTVDMPYSYIAGRGIRVLFYSYAVNGQTYPDDMGRDPEALPRFYDFLKEGNIPTTSQINEFAYEEFFREILKEGHDILHIAFGTGMTKSYFQALEAVEILKKEFPDRDIIVIDSLCSSSGYGLIVDDVKDMLDEGKPVDEIVAWVNENRYRIHHQFFSVDLKYYRRTGRMSGPTAAVATVLKICPIMRLNAEGKIIAYDKVMGKKNAIKRTVETMVKHCDDGVNYSRKVYICHSNCLQDAELTRQALKEKFPNLKGEIPIFDIGTIIAAHCGPGTVAVFFHGDERAK